MRVYKAENKKKTRRKQDIKQDFEKTREFCLCNFAFAIGVYIEHYTLTKVELYTYESRTIHL